ncbi:enoyl-CoA hydratase/isomerase family protein, partial [Streptococcus suis]
LDTALEQLLETLLNNGPVAVRAAKQLINDVAGHDINGQIINLTADRIAEIRVSEEGQEGLTAFFEKRPPNWQK